MVEFQSTLPREERPRALLIYIPDYTISIHAPTRGATKSTALLKLIRKISIHAPTRGATTTNAPSCRIFLFQSTLPREERQIPCWCYVRRQQYFNPRSHERSDRHTGNRSKRCKNFNPRSHERSDLLQLKRILSRHAFQSTLPREERPIYSGSAKGQKTFQSTLPREERLDISSAAIRSWLFQSTLPREERRNSKDSDIHWICISIHAPTRGATMTLSEVQQHSQFQSTLPREERLLSGLYHGNYWNISIHAPTRGATDGGVYICKQPLISIHAPTRGATLTHRFYSSAYKHFNPRSHERSDIIFDVGNNSHYYFNPRSHERSDDVFAGIGIYNILFQSTLPREERR